MRAILILRDEPLQTLPPIYHLYGKKRGQLEKWEINGDGRRRTPAMIKAEVLKAYSKWRLVDERPVLDQPGHTKYIFEK